MFTQPHPTLRREADHLIILDQTELPWRAVERQLASLADVAEAITTLRARGAPLIGCVAAFGVAIALNSEGPDDATLARIIATLKATRPTAVNLAWALTRLENHLTPLPPATRVEAAWAEAEAIRAEDAAMCEAIGQHGLERLHALPVKPGRPLTIMTHCNAGWLATAGAGTALAPVYAAQTAGIPIEVFVSETRPRFQGLLTAWELAAAGINHTLIADNAAGILLARGEVDAVIVGADRIAANGDTANKVGTYLKALAARASGIPFFVAAPKSTFDANTPNGDAIPIELRDADEVRRIVGLDAQGLSRSVALADSQKRVANPAFDITPVALIDGFITEFGIR